MFKAKKVLAVLGIFGLTVLYFLVFFSLRQATLIHPPYENLRLACVMFAGAHGIGVFAGVINCVRVFLLRFQTAIKVLSIISYGFLSLSGLFVVFGFLTIFGVGV